MAPPRPSLRSYTSAYSIMASMDHGRCTCALQTAAFRHDLGLWVHSPCRRINGIINVNEVIRPLGIRYTVAIDDLRAPHRPTRLARISQPRTRCIFIDPAHILTKNPTAIMRAALHNKSP